MICPACGFDSNYCSENTYTLVLPRAAQSLNSVGVNHKTNHKYRRERRAWAYQLTRYGALDIPEAEGKRRIFFLRQWAAGKRAYDYGNLVGGFKPLLDMVVDCGLLIDDKPKHCADYYKQMRSPDGTDRVIITLEDYYSEP